jgi:hypothetical protein
MNGHRPALDEVGAQLRRRVLALDERVQPPPDLFDRITAGRPVRTPARPRWSVAVLAATAVAGLILGVVLGVGWSNRARLTPGAATGAATTVSVYNAEAPCQRLRTIECGLGVYRDPYHQTPNGVAARVWHGDSVTIRCVVADGFTVVDEQGVSSTRWYRVTTAEGVTGYLPGVRTRNTVEIALC